MAATPPTPTFARIWRGRTTRKNADAYGRYWRSTGSAPLVERGALSVQMLREDRATETEFAAISWRDSLEAVAPGGDPYLTHHLPEDETYLIELPERVQILRLLDTRERRAEQDAARIRPNGPTPIAGPQWD